MYRTSEYIHMYQCIYMSVYQKCSFHVTIQYNTMQKVVGWQINNLTKKIGETRKRETFLVRA